MERSVIAMALGCVALVVMACGGSTPAPASAPASSAPAPAAAPAPAKAAESPAKPAQAPAKPAAAPAKPAAAGTAKVLRFAGVNGLTGQSAAFGTRTQQGAELAAKLVNAKGGLTDSCGNTYTVEVSRGDMANDRNQAIALLRGAADNKDVLAVVGPTPSVGLIAMVPVAGQVKMPLLGMGVAPIKDWNPYAFRVTFTVEVADAELLKTLHRKFKLDKIAVIYDQTQDMQAASNKVVQDNAKAIGFEVVAAEAFRAGDQDFTTQLTKIKGTGVKWVAIFAATPELAKISRQMRDLGIDANIFTGSATFQDPQAWDLSGGAIKDGYTWSAFDLKSKDAKVQDFLTAYKASFSDEPTIQAVWGHDAILVALDAVKRSCSNTDREKFIATLGNTPGFQGIGGKISFKNPPSGENLTPAIIVTQTTGRGEFVVVE